MTNFLYEPAERTPTHAPAYFVAITADKIEGKMVTVRKGGHEYKIVCATDVRKAIGKYSRDFECVLLRRYADWLPLYYVVTVYDASEATALRLLGEQMVATYNVYEEPCDAVATAIQRVNSTTATPAGETIRATHLAVHHAESQAFWEGFKDAFDDHP